MKSDKGFEYNKKRHYNVAVVGGGIAGISAALSAARLGKKVLLAESSYILGGLVTSGLVTIYLPLCDGLGHQLSFGIAEELLRLSISMGAEGDYPDAWFNNCEDCVAKRSSQRYLTRFNPHVFAVLCERLLRENGVDILYGATMSKLSKNKSGDSVSSITLITKTDSYVIYSDSFVDCTGDATVFYHFGTETFLPYHKNGNAAWYYELINGEYRLKQIGSCFYISSDKVNEGISGLDGEENSAEVIKSHSIILDDFIKNGDVSKTHALATLPTIPQVRMTRMINGVYRIKKTDDKKHFDTSVGLFGSWLEKGPAFELPLETLYSSKIKNLCAAGRCISVMGDDMWDITRVIPVCAVSGEAAGVLAALSSDFSNIYVRDVQSVLSDRNIPLHLNEIGL